MLPHDPSFRDASGKTDESKIRAFVDKEYPGVTVKPSSGGPPEQVIGRTPSGGTIVRRGNGTTYTRASKKGDSFPGPETTVPPGGRKIDMNQLQCP